MYRVRYDQVNARLLTELLSVVAPGSAAQDVRCSCKTKNPVSPPPEVTLTIGVADKRTIAPQTLPRKRNGFVSTNIGCNFQSVSLKIGNTSGCKSSASCTM